MVFYHHESANSCGLAQKSFRIRKAVMEDIGEENHVKRVGFKWEGSAIESSVFFPFFRIPEVMGKLMDVGAGPSDRPVPR